MPKVNTRIDNPKTKTTIASGFLGGLNTFQDQTLIRDSELTEAKNIVLTVDGIEPRYGTTWFANSVGTRTYGAIGYYKSDGTREFLRVANQRLQKSTAGGNFSAIGATSFANAMTVLLQVRDNIYAFNGSDNLRKYDGSTVTTYTALTTPVNLSVTPTGTTGTTAYSYRISAFNDNGNTVACTPVATATGNATLSSTNYNALNWDDVAGAVGYNVWGRKADGLGETLLTTVYVSAYNDIGTYTPSLDIFPPEGNTSGGIKGKFACFAISRMFVAGDPDNPSRMYWGGIGENIDNFSWDDAAGGGAIDIYKNDGSEIRAIIPFQGGVIVGKDNAIYKFSFASDGGAQLEEITRSFGMISHYATLAVENDVIFPAKKDGRLAFYSLGNQENYAATVLRTNELSIKISAELENVNLGYLQYAPAFYYRNVYGCAIPTGSNTANNRVWCLDTRFGAWVNWDDLSPSCFSEFTDTDGTQNMYLGHNTDGYMWTMFQDDRNDNGAAISVSFATKAFNEGSFHIYKDFIAPTFQFKNIYGYGTIGGTIVIDGLLEEKVFSITSAMAGGLGFGASLIGSFLFGDATGGTPEDATAADQLVEVDDRFHARSIKYKFTSDTVGMRYKFLSLAHEAMPLTYRRLDQESRIY